MQDKCFEIQYENRNNISNGLLAKLCKLAELLVYHMFSYSKGSKEVRTHSSFVLIGNYFVVYLKDVPNTTLYLILLLYTTGDAVKINYFI